MCKIATTAKANNSREKKQGMNWITQVKRLAIYLRDGLACAYCGASIAEGAQLSLDHIQPYSKGGSNEAENLVTCCTRCNSSRGNRSVNVFVKSVAAYINHGTTPAAILMHIKNCRRRALDTKQAKELIAKQGSCFKVLQNLN